MCYRRVCGSTPGDWDANNPVLALSLRRCRTTAHTSSAAPRFPTMLLSPRPFGSRLGGRLGVMNPELRPPLVAIPSVRDTAHTFIAHGSPVVLLNRGIYNTSVDIPMALVTDYECFSSSCCHRFNPQWFFLATILFQVCKLSDVVYLGSIC